MLSSNAVLTCSAQYSATLRPGGNSVDDDENRFCRRHRPQIIPAQTLPHIAPRRHRHPADRRTHNHVQSRIPAGPVLLDIDREHFDSMGYAVLRVLVEIRHESLAVWAPRRPEKHNGRGLFGYLRKGDVGARKRLQLPPRCDIACGGGLYVGGHGQECTGKEENNCSFGSHTRNTREEPQESQGRISIRILSGVISHISIMSELETAMQPLVQSILL